MGEGERTNGMGVLSLSACTVEAKMISLKEKRHTWGNLGKRLARIRKQAWEKLGKGLDSLKESLFFF